MRFSEKLRAAVKLSPLRMYVLAQHAGLHPSTLSKLLNGITAVKPGDPRILRLGALLGLGADELFEVGRDEGTLDKAAPQHGQERGGER